MSNDNQKTYKVTIKNAPPATHFSLYIDGIPGQISGGVVTGTDYSFKIPNQYQGEGKIKFLIPTRTRTFTNIFFSIPIKADGNDITVNVSEVYPPKTKPRPKNITAQKKFLQNNLKEKVKEREEQITTRQEESETNQDKKFLENDLKTAVVERKQQSKKSSFWDKLK